MRHLTMIAVGAILALAGLGAPAAEASDNFTFSMVPTGSSESCVPGASGRVTISPTLGLVENMHVEVSGLPPNTDFDLFVIQQPNAPFGMAWYVADMLTDANGVAVGDFVGRFSIETFLVASGSVAAPVVKFKGSQFPDANSNPVTAPIQTYHLGLWFDSTADAGKAGCSTNVTPFNGTHNAGVQILNTSNFPNLFGPLRHVK